MMADTTGRDLVPGGFYTVTARGYTRGNQAQYLHRVYTVSGWQYIFRSAEGVTFGGFADDFRVERLAG